MASKKAIKIIGLIATGVGLAANLVSSWVSDKKMEDEIEAKVIEKMKELEKITDDSDFIMIQIGGHTGDSYPITHIEDSQCIGFWELRCDPTTNFWDELEIARENKEL